MSNQESIISCLYQKNSQKYFHNAAKISSPSLLPKCSSDCGEWNKTEIISSRTIFCLKVNIHLFYGKVEKKNLECLTNTKEGIIRCIDIGGDS
jgi:hypothetical protein